MVEIIQRDFMSQKEKVKQVRDSIAPILVNQARLEMMRMYKPGMVDPVGEATVGVLISTEPIRSIQGPFIQRDFYACYKIYVPLKPLIPVKDPSARELLQEQVLTKIHASNIHEKVLKGEGTLVIYAIDFWVTKDGEVWHEEGEGLWRKVLQLPEGLLQVCYLNLRANLHVKYEV